jgi:hypothetical protein
MRVLISVPLSCLCLIAATVVPNTCFYLLPRRALGFRATGGIGVGVFTVNFYLFIITRYLKGLEHGGILCIYHRC